MDSAQQLCFSAEWISKFVYCPGLNRMVPGIWLWGSDSLFPAILSSFHRRCWFNKKYGGKVGFTVSSPGEQFQIFGKPAFKKSLNLTLQGLNRALPVEAVMSEAIPDDWFPILGQQVREATGFTVVESAGAVDLKDIPFGRYLLFPGTLRKKDANCPF